MKVRKTMGVTGVSGRQGGASVIRDCAHYEKPAAVSLQTHGYEDEIEMICGSC